MDVCVCVFCVFVSVVPVSCLHVLCVCKVDVVHEGRSKVIGTMLLPTSMDNWPKPVDGYLDVVLTEQPITSTMTRDLCSACPSVQT